MIRSLKNNRFVLLLWKGIKKIAEGSDNKALAIQGFMLLLTAVLVSFFINTLDGYQTEVAEIQAILDAGDRLDKGRVIPPKTPAITQGIGMVILAVAFLLSLRLRGNVSELRRARIVKTVFWIAAIGVMVAWLPSDYAVTQASLAGKSYFGEVPSAPAYAGKLFLISLLIVSFPITVMLHYRSSIMDQYVVRNFMTPFVFCIVGFVAIWLIFDLIDNATDLSGADISTVFRFYLVQLPWIIVFVLPATLLLSLLYSLSRMSTSNEFISMLGSGRSVLRVLRPLFLIGLYCTLISLVFKYEWAPNAVGYKESLLVAIQQERRDGGKKKRMSKSAGEIAKVGWMHVNEVDNRTWFVGRVPRDLNQKMFSIVIWQMADDGTPAVIWKAAKGRWEHGMQPPEWWLDEGKSYTYDENGVPRVQTFKRVRLPGWRETPWKVTSSSQNPEHLGLPGLTLYLNTNADYTDRDLAKFRTNWWDIFAEPFWCFVMVIVAAPLGIVYSRRGVMGGVAASIIIFALMYLIRYTMIAMGQASLIPPWFAAWGNNLMFAGVGATLLWFRARNREIPKFSQVVHFAFIGFWKRLFRGEKYSEEVLPTSGILTEPISPALTGSFDVPLDPETIESLESTLAKIKSGSSDARAVPS
ncbi:MAG: YjgP/YjgQ family permease [Verrucomicrobiales bacterium]|nr:YjgP/YjgQ family permease [Verrucomicrobiales bacterium]